MSAAEPRQGLAVGALALGYQRFAFFMLEYLVALVAVGWYSPLNQQTCQHSIAVRRRKKDWKWKIPGELTKTGLQNGYKTARKQKAQP